jgi:hypothetical protein
MSLQWLTHEGSASGGIDAGGMVKVVLEPGSRIEKGASCHRDATE